MEHGLLLHLKLPENEIPFGPEGSFPFGTQPLVGGIGTGSAELSIGLHRYRNSPKSLFYLTSS